MQSKEIRNTFLEFFKSKNHKIVPSAPLVLRDDPSLMFTNAGMNQFKDAFLGNKAPQAPRITDTQKCLRVSGKHNDLEEVGIDTYHHTFFEMLGNWSFGDYFKVEAIAFAWELLTEKFGIDKEKLYVTVFGGDASDGLPADEEAEAIWKKYVPEERILRCDKKDNFWEMGETGPCGPCTEIHVDIRSEEEKAQTPGRLLVNQDHPQVIEIWNVVFIQFNRLANGSLQALAQQHVDTGMGLERLCMVLQGKTSNYDTDIFQVLIGEIEQLTGKTYGASKELDIAMRVISDHIRAVAFVIADGQLPSNNGPGYVIRRILRRAIRYGYTFFGLEEPFMNSLLPALAKIYEDIFPELKQQLNFLQKTIKAEEESFLRTLDTGIRLFEAFVNDKKWQNRNLDPEELAAWERKEIPGKFAFELFDTFGFPFDLTQLLAKEKGFHTDEKGFEEGMAQQKERSRKASASSTGDWVEVHKQMESEFMGYSHRAIDTRIVKFRKIKKAKEELFQIVLENTPFYPEGGGQVGDTGTLSNVHETIEVVDTQKENDLIIHFTKTLPENPEANFRAEINHHRRKSAEYNHSATHLLHASLREVLGKHVQQKGSLVSPDVLRFDFSHPDKLTQEELAKVEDRVNEQIRAAIPSKIEVNIPIEEAKAKGAMALFGEKYGESVRVVTFDPAFSIELCGGTHVENSGEIGLFLIISESSVAAGVRRIEAITGQKAMEFARQQTDELAEIQKILKIKDNPTEAVEKLLKERSALLKEIERFQLEQINSQKEHVVKSLSPRKGIRAAILRMDFPSGDAAKKLAFDLKHQYDDLFLVTAGLVNGKPFIQVMLGDTAIEKTGADAGKLVREWAKSIQGGGGGQHFYATAGGKNPDGISEVLKSAQEFVDSL